MEVITKDEVRLNRNDQARRIEGYRFNLWMMERKKRHAIVFTDRFLCNGKYDVSLTQLELKNIFNDQHFSIYRAKTR
jgi:hypothetical protein